MKKMKKDTAVKIFLALLYLVFVSLFFYIEGGVYNRLDMKSTAFAVIMFLIFPFLLFIETPYVKHHFHYKVFFIAGMIVYIYYYHKVILNMF